MPLSIVTGGSRQAASRVSVLSDSLRPAQTAKILTGGTLRTFFNVATSTPSAFTVTADRDAYAYSRGNGSRQTLTTNSVTITPTGGAAPYTYQWTLTQSDGQISITSPTMATTTFYATLAYTTVSGTALCTVREAGGAMATVEVSVTISNEGNV